MAAAHGHTQSLHTNALDEALALPSDFSARIARNTQLFLQQETDTCNVVDAWGGSYYVERLTHDLAQRAWSHIREVEELGGMTKAIQAGIPKMRIEEASARTQARIDSGQQVVIGVNKYRPTAEENIKVLHVDTSAVRESQIANLKRLRAERNQAEVDAALAALAEAARTGYWESARIRRCGRACQGHGRRNQRGIGKSIRPLRGTSAIGAWSVRCCHGSKQRRPENPPARCPVRKS